MNDDSPPDSPEPIPEELMAAAFAARPLDTIALPLLAPLAEFVVRCEEHPFWYGRIDELAAYETACQTAPSFPGADDPAVLAAVMLTGTLVAQCASSIMDFVLLDESLFGEDGEGPATLTALKQWFVRERPHPAEAALVSASFAACHDSPLFPVAGRRSREISRALFHYARFQGATDWASAFVVGRDYWRDADRRERLLLRAWSSALGATTLAEGEKLDLERRHQRELAAARQRNSGPTLALLQLNEHADREGANAELAELGDAYREAAAEIELLKQQLRDGRAKARSAREERDAARGELDPLRRELERQTRHARAITLLHGELRASLDDGHAEDIAPPPDQGWPPDLLAGCDIRLYTGQERSGVREQMAEALRAVGASVEAFDGNGRAGMPDSFPEGTVVVCDVRFMSHTWSGRLADRAARSGATYVEVRAGQGGIVRAVASALGR